MGKSKEKKKIEIVATFSDGWQERFTIAAYELYLRAKEDENHQFKTA